MLTDQFTYFHTLFPLTHRVLVKLKYAAVASACYANSYRKNLKMLQLRMNELIRGAENPTDVMITNKPKLIKSLMKQYRDCLYLSLFNS